VNRYERDHDGLAVRSWMTDSKSARQ
jgi:hypothetical protein